MAPINYVHVADVASRSRADESHAVKANTMSGRLSCSCEAYRWSRAPKGCKHIYAVVSDPTIKPFVVQDVELAQCLSQRGIQHYVSIAADDVRHTRAVSSVIAQVPRPTLPTRAVTTGRAVAERQRVALDGLTVDRLMAAARQHGVSMRQAQAVAIVEMLTGKAHADADAIASLAMNQTGITRRIVLED